MQFEGLCYAIRYLNANKTQKNKTKNHQPGVPLLDFSAVRAATPFDLAMLLCSFFLTLD